MQYYSSKLNAKKKLAQAVGRIVLVIGIISVICQATNSSSQSSSNIQDSTTTTTDASPSPIETTSSDCHSPCSSNELALILAKFSAGEDVLNLASSTSSAKTTNNSGSPKAESTQPDKIRVKCIKQLVVMIRDLASGELEMKTLLEFASSSSPLPAGKRLDLSSLRAPSQSSNTTTPNEQQCNQKSGQPQPALELILGDDAPGGSGSGSSTEDKRKFLPKLAANVDHWIDTIERFTLTREWTAIMKIFHGAESILNMFIKTTINNNGAVQMKNNNTTKRLMSNYSSETHKEFLQKLEQSLPIEVQTLANSLNQLFPWHVWPWNNLDLYSTLDTFLNHGIFAFSKTTSGPERRIDYLSLMLTRLFKSLKSDAFPKKCHDWSRIICDLEAFHDRLVILVEPEESHQSNQTQWRQEQLKELISVNNNKLTQELTCIMFSSLSMQQFGAKDNVDFRAMFDASNETLATGSQLQWDKQVRKALRLYRLSREALTDEQWRALYQEAKDAWTRTKISDRVIMLGRIVQLLTNCHMPKEILESALWKDIYKYKNALNQISDIVIEELNRSSENGKFTIGQLAIGSKNLEDILTRFLRLLPRLIEALSKSIVDGLPELVNKFFNEKLAYMKGPCKGFSLADLIPSLSEYRQELVELELLVCKQLRTKPSITMAQINNLTNEFLAMVFSANFTQTFGGAALQSALPKFWPSPITGAIQASSSNVNRAPVGGMAVATQPAIMHRRSLVVSSSDQDPAEKQTTTTTTANGSRGDNSSSSSSSSIIDELAANPRLAQIVAILQSSALDPPEVHAELPELDWVEAGTSVALLYETIQRLMSYEGLFMIFPELPKFQEEISERAQVSKLLFQRFIKRDAFQLTAYALDTAMPITLRTFQPLDSFHSECLSTFRDIFGDVGHFGAPSSPTTTSQPSFAPNVTPRESRQWQCAVSSINFASFALNNFIRTFNIMLQSIMNQMSQQRKLANHQNKPPGNNSNCILFDGSITTLMDNLPQIVDLAFETILIASTNPIQHQHQQQQQQQQQLLKETLCSRESQVLDPFGDQVQLARQQKLRQAICHLLHESSLVTCGEALRAGDWTSTMKELNVTWFEAPVTSIEPSFCGILKGVHRFLDLFGKVKPSSMSDGLIARVLNFNSYWQTLVKKAVSSLEKYREKRFELALQVLVPIIGDYLLSPNSSEARQTLELSALRARSLLGYLTSSNSEPLASGSANLTLIMATNQTTEQQFKTLFDLLVRHSSGLAESVLRTSANNLTKLELFVGELGARQSSNHSPKESNQFWAKFCSAPIETYLDFEPIETVHPGGQNKASLPSQLRYLDMSSAKESFCRFNWSHFDADLLVNYGVPAAAHRQLGQLTDRHLVRVALTKWGQVLDVVLDSGASARAPRVRLPRFLTLSYWQPLQEKLAQITPLKDEPTNFSWIWDAFEQLILAWDAAQNSSLVSSNNNNNTNTLVASNSTLMMTTTNTTTTSVHEALVRIFDQLNCALDAVKGGITWDNLANIYSDRQDILAAHSTLNNGIALASAGANTFLAHKKFQRFLDDFVKPKLGLSAFCDMRDKTRLESIFTAPDHQRLDDLSQALESFQEFICDTNVENLIQNLNPISFCYTQATNQTSTTGPQPQQPIGVLSDTIDRFFKLASLAVLDAKLVETIDAKPPIFDKAQWDQLRSWWLNQTEVHQGNSGLALTLVRVFQTLDSVNSEHVVWRAIFRSVYELSEVSAYLLRAAEMERSQTTSAFAPTMPGAKNETTARDRLDLGGRNAVSRLVGPGGQQRLASTLTNVMFPEANNFISFRTFKQLRYLKSISDYFAQNQDAQEGLCQNLTAATSDNQLTTISSQHSSSSSSSNNNNNNNNNKSRFELIDYKLDSSEKLFSLLCHYHSSQWLTAMNIVLSKRTASLSKKTNYMTKYLSMFTRNFKDNENLQSFIHGQQLENIEAVANTTVVYLIAISKPFRTLKLSKISTMSWHSLPNLLEQIDSHLCLSKFDGNSSAYQQVVYEPKKPDIEVIICKLPSWNITQVYNYFSENFDLQNMISLVAQNNRTAAIFGITLGATSDGWNHLASTANLNNSNRTSSSFNLTTEVVHNQTLMLPSDIPTPQNNGLKTCTTPFRFASKWLKIIQDLIDETMSKGSHEKIKKCLGANRKNQSVYSQTLRFLKLFNSALTTLNDFTVNNSWHFVRRSWNSISYALLNQTPTPSNGAAGGVPLSSSSSPQAHNVAMQQPHQRS